MRWWLPGRKPSPSEPPVGWLAHPSSGAWRDRPAELPLHPRYAGRQLVTEAAAFLEGRAGPPGRNVPVWLPMSLLAHGDRAALVDLARPERFPAEWEAGVAYLATEILVLTSDDASLAAVQRGALIPLELDLLSRRVSPPRRINQLVDLVLDALREYYQVSS